MGRKTDISKFSGVGLTKAEKRKGKKLFEQYIETYDMSNVGDFQLLEELVYKELTIEKIKDKIKELSELEDMKKDKNVIPYKLRKELDDNIKVKVELQEKLGLFNREEKNQDSYDKHEREKKRFKSWLKENQASRQTPCPHCGQMIMLKMDLTHWETLKHPWFKDKFLWNQHGWDLYKAGKITALDLAKILLGKNCQSMDFITWLEENQVKKNQESEK